MSSVSRMCHVLCQISWHWENGNWNYWLCPQINISFPIPFFRVENWVGYFQRSLGFSGLSTMRGGGERNEGLGKKENSELLRTLLFSNNWSLYDKYIHIYRHRVPCFATVWPRIFTEIWSNLWMRFLITLFWLLMKSFQKSSEMSIVTYILLSLPWTDGKVPRELLAGQNVPCNIAGFVERALFWGAQVKGH